MKVYQCIHKYPPHIPQFEEKHGITDYSDLSFSKLQQLIIDDGYAAAYILHPALEHKSEEVFFTIWDYERLQYLWAKENGINTTDLKKIKLAQIEKFNPDVVYNHSPFCDDNFIEELLPQKRTMKLLCWNGLIEPTPRIFHGYNCHLSLHRPYVNFWRNAGLNAFELQPGIPAKWVSNSNGSIRTTDVLSYGQYHSGMFSKRNEIIKKLIQYKLGSNHKIDIHLQIANESKRIFGISGMSLINFRNKHKSMFDKTNAYPPVYGEELYKKIADSKIVINAYTDNNKDFKSNMRLYEAIGHGAFLISEHGNYPDGFDPCTDFYTYNDYKSLEMQIEKVLSDWPEHSAIAKATQTKISRLYSKENQWLQFKECISKL